MANPFDYSLCCQVVTCYRKTGDAVTRQVLDGVFYSYRDRVTGQMPGTCFQRLFTLIIPGEVVVQPGDRIYDGVGPEVNAAGWAGFIPACVPGLSQVQYAMPCFWEGSCCHTEAGRKAGTV